MNAVNWIAYSGVTRGHSSASPAGKALTGWSAATAAGALVGAALGAVSATVSDDARLALATLTGLLGLGLAVAALTGHPVPVMQRNTESPQRWLRLPPKVWSAANGSVLGLGFTSRLGSWAWYVVPVGALLSGSAATGALVWGAYAFARLGTSVVIATVAHARPHMDWGDKLFSCRPRARSSETVLLLVASVVALLYANSPWT